MHNTKTTLRRRLDAARRPRRARAYAPAVAAACAAFALLILACVQAARAESPQLEGTRYIIETRETATYYVGKQGSFNLVLIGQDGHRLNAPADLKTTVTVTTLDSLEEARGALGPRRPSAPRRLITLARGQQAVQFTFTHRRGEQDEAVHLLSNQPGRLHIFAECENVATGETTVVVLDRHPARTAAPPVGEFMPASWQVWPASLQEDGAGDYKLDLLPSRRPTIQTSGTGEQIAYFKVGLMKGNDFYPAPQDIRIILRVEEGYAGLVPDTLTIPRGEVITPEQSELRTRPGGDIKVSAGAGTRLNNSRIIPVSRSYEFTPGVHSTRLVINKQRESAYANGLDEIELQVVALQDGHAITPKDEGMDERVITLGFKGDSQGVKFENGKGEVVIPKDQMTGSIKLFSARPVSELRVVANSWNGLRDSINAGEEGTPVSFSFPWLQLLFAMVGGVTFPLLRRPSKRSIAQGLVVGVIFFGLALFGAFLSDPQRLGAISITLTKLPTENTLASFILGFLGSTFLLFLFKGRGDLQVAAVPGDGGASPNAAHKKRRAPARAGEVRSDAHVGAVGADADSRTRRV